MHTKTIALLLFIFIFSMYSKLLLGNEKYNFVVNQNGVGDFLTVQEAINSVPDFRKNRTTIFIANGIYKEKLILPTTKTNVTFIGEDVNKTILTYDDFASKKNRFGEEKGTTGSSSFFVFGEGFIAQNITFENSSGSVGQAVAVRIESDKVIFENCKFLGNQDTLYPHGKNSRQYYKNCYIEGTIDFIFGWSTALFEECDIFCKSAGYITAASTLETTEFGFVFLKCKISGNAPLQSVYLGRPWRPYSKVAFIECNLDSIIKPEGWDNWRNPENEKTATYAEYKNSGTGADISKRVNWSNQLNDEQVKSYSLKNIFKDWDPNSLN